MMSKAVLIASKFFNVIQKLENLINLENKQRPLSRKPHH